MQWGRPTNDLLATCRLQSNQAVTTSYLAALDLDGLRFRWRLEIGKGGGRW